MTHTRHATVCECNIGSYIYDGEILTRDGCRDNKRRGVRGKVVVSWTVMIHGSGRVEEGRYENERVACVRKRVSLYVAVGLGHSQVIVRLIQCLFSSINWFGVCLGCEWHAPAPNTY